MGVKDRTLYDRGDLRVTVRPTTTGYSVLVRERSTGIHLTGRGASLRAAGQDAREQFHGAYMAWKARRLIRSRARDEADERRLLEACGLLAYTSMPRTDLPVSSQAPAVAASSVEGLSATAGDSGEVAG